MKPGSAPSKSIRLLDQLRQHIRHLHYRLSTEKVYLCWMKFFVRWQAQQPGGLRQPRDMGAPEVEAEGGTASPLDALARHECGEPELPYFFMDARPAAAAGSERSGSRRGFWLALTGASDRASPTKGSDRGKRDLT